MDQRPTSSSQQPLVVYAKRAVVFYFAGGSAAIAGLGGWASLAAPNISLGGLVVGAGGSLFFLYCAAWIVLRYRGPILVLFDSGLTYHSRRGPLLRAEHRSVAWDAIAHVHFRTIPRGGRAMIITERPESHGGRRLPDLRVNLGFLDVSSGVLVDRMNELAMAKGIILH
jgi:hypothetical protein